MANNTVIQSKPVGTREWLFHWRDPQVPMFPTLLAITFVAMAFTFLLSVKVRLPQLEKSLPRKASLIYLADDAQGRLLTLRAIEGGPFPSRFKPNNWEGFVPLEIAGMEAARIPTAPYVSQLQDLPTANQLSSLPLAARGEAFLPKRSPTKIATPAPLPLKLAPTLYPFSGITREMIPRELPPFTATIDSTMSSASWRFLVRLNSEGGVAECVSLEKSNGTGAAELEKWLQKIRFNVETGKSVRWISLGVGFTNQPTDGTNAR